MYYICMYTYIWLWEGDGTPLQYSCLENPMDRGAWWAAVHRVAKSWTRLSDFNFTFHFHALEKEMATHSSVLAWRSPGMGEPGGLPSMGSHRVRHDWSDLAAAAAYIWLNVLMITNLEMIFCFSFRWAAKWFALMCVCVYIYICFWLFSIIGYYKILSIVNCCIHKSLLFIYYMYSICIC